MALPRWIAVACVLIALLFAGLESTHVHGPAGSGNVGRPCVICISAHASAPTVTTTTIPVLLMVEGVAVPYAIEASSSTNLLDIFIRPPPCA
jgi:hypothetical protein